MVSWLPMAVGPAGGTRTLVGLSGGHFEPRSCRSVRGHGRHCTGQAAPGTQRSRESGSRARTSAGQPSETSGASEGPTRTSSLLLRVVEELGEGVGRPQLVLLGDPGVDRGRLDARVHHLLLDDRQVVPAGPVQVRRIGVATRMGGVPRIQPHGRHEAFHHPPDPIPGEGPPLAEEDRGLLGHILPKVPLPGQEGFQVRLEVRGDEDLPLLVPLALADRQ